MKRFLCPDRWRVVLLSLLLFWGLPAATQELGASPQITDVYVQRGGPPLNVLNVRLSLYNSGVTGAIQASLWWRSDPAQAWQELKSWAGLMLPSGYKRSLEYVGPSQGFPLSFQIRAQAVGADGVLQERIVNREPTPVSEDAPQTRPSPSATPTPDLDL